MKEIHVKIKICGKNKEKKIKKLKRRMEGKKRKLNEKNERKEKISKTGKQWEEMKNKMVVKEIATRKRKRLDWKMSRRMI